MAWVTPAIWSLFPGSWSFSLSWCLLICICVSSSFLLRVGSRVGLQEPLGSVVEETASSPLSPLVLGKVGV